MPTRTHNCIICMQDESYAIVGPFTSTKDLVTFGKLWQATHDDDPRWQSIYLADPAAKPTVFTPT
jgi:hypothetical protein